MQTSTETRHAALERLFDAFNRHDADGVMACFADSIVFEAAAGPEAAGRRFVGKDAVRAAFVGVWTDMPDVAWHVRAHTVAGDRAFSEWLFVATRPDGMRIEVEGIDIFRFEGEKIIAKSAMRKDRPPQPVRLEMSA